MSASATVQMTGEVIELPAKTPAELIESMRLCNEYLQAYDAVKKKLQKVAAEMADRGEQLEHDGYMVRTYTTQRMTYDKAVLRNVFDQDELDLFLEPAKGKIDAYIKDHLADLGDKSTLLRESMIPVGRAYSTVRLERLDRPEARA